MRAHRYPGLFGDRRQKGLATALVVSMGLHAGLFYAFTRFHIQPVERTFYAPIHVVNLTGPFPAEPAGRRVQVKARPAKPGRPKPPPEKPARIKPAPKKPAAPSPKTRPKARAVPLKPESKARPLPAEPATAAAPESPVAEKVLEERLARRLEELRRKHVGEAPESPAGEGILRGVGEQRVSQAIEAIRKRLDAASPEGPGGSGAAGLAGTRSALAELRLRPYYNRLWEHVKRHWAVPPGVRGRGLSVIVSVVIDRQGRILRTVLEESSGSRSFDESALRALARSEPLPPIPDDVADATLEVGFRFHGD